MNSIYTLINLHKLVRSNRVKFAGVLGAHLLKLRHLLVRFDPVVACNLSCRMCYFHDPQYRKERKGIFTPVEIERIAKLFLPRTFEFVIGCGTEPTLYKGFPDLVKLGKDYGVPNVGFVSNGQLLKEEHFEKFVSYGLDELVLSLHGVTKPTYEFLMVNASFDRFHEALQQLDAVKKRNGSTKPALRLNYAVTARNWRELEQFFTVFDRYEIETLQIRTVFDMGGEYDPIPSHEQPQFKPVVESLERECKKRGIRFVGDIVDLQDTRQNVILEAVHRYITPEKVWRDDFRWSEETYDEYCKRVGWSRFLLRCVTSNLANTELADTVGRRYAGIDEK